MIVTGKFVAIGHISSSSVSLSETNPLIINQRVNKKMINTAATYFSGGADGWGQACEWLGIDVVSTCEMVPYRQERLKQLYPKAKHYGHTEEITEPVQADIYLGSPPCQGWSKAGKKKGMADPRNGWYEWLRIVRSGKPLAWVAENVFEFAFDGLDEVLSEMEKEGYSCLPVGIPVAGTGGWILRDRLWIIGIHSETHAQRSGSLNTGPHRAEVHQHRKAQFRDKQKRFAGSLVQEGIRTGTNPRVHGNPYGISDRKDRIEAVGDSLSPFPAMAVLIHLDEYLDNGPAD